MIENITAAIALIILITYIVDVIFDLKIFEKLPNF